LRGGALKYVLIALLFVLAGVSVGLFVTVRTLRGLTAPTEAEAPAPTFVERVTGRAAGVDTGDSRRTAIVRAAERVGPATVSITAVKTRIVSGAPRPGDAFFDRFLRGYFPDWLREEQYHSFGSGVIIDPDGYLLTNDHVVGRANAVTVTLNDGREYEGRVLGSDPRYDLAVVKVEGENLPVAPLGDSDDVIVGEWAIAIGNPFGYLLNDPDPTVTAGVISALHRDVQGEGESGAIYKDMIQTDAAINPGNSGGPLVNSRGEVIGISSFIFSSSGGSQGIGFAIPINIARQIINELIEFGRVRDVWVGIKVQPLSRTIAERLRLSSADGVLVSYVEDESPAARAGISPGDVIVGVNGEPVTNIRQARRAIFGSRVGDVIRLTVVRAGETMHYDLELEEVPR
jgi:serine protease Do